MVRLNEPPVLGDTVEALKRRFIRQNREIARANSTQSAKIRTLECETSHLLSENIALREENIKLQKALEEAQRQSGSINISVFRERFESKVQELNELLGELSTTPVKEARTTPGKLRRKAARQSLFQRMRPTPEQLAENAVAEGRLAPIFEDKVTLEDDFDDDVRLSIPEITDITDSPDLRPSSKAHSEDGDPVKLSFTTKELLSGSPSRTMEPQNDSDRRTGFLSSNLETRKRRRESSTAKDMTAETAKEVTEATLETKGLQDPAAREAPKIGAKRKLGSREEEPKLTSKTSSQQRLGANIRSNQEDLDVRRTKSHVNLSSIGASMSKVQSRSTTGLSTSQGRRALGEKPVNTDPVVSPGKPKAAADNKTLNPKKDLVAKPRERLSAKEKPTIRQIRPLKAQADTTEPVVDDIQLPPKTPALVEDDVFSPGSSNSSATKVESRDTPPPSELHDANASAAGRASRRQRSAVSYAEPSLRDKMRRPGKEMVDAISGLQRSRASISELPQRDEHYLSEVARLENEPLQLDGEPGVRSLKNKEPTSPLTSRSMNGSSHLDPSILATTSLADRHRRSTTIGHSQALSTEESRSSSSHDTISALISSSQKKLARVNASSFEPQVSETEASSLVDSLSVFDLHLSSPPRGDALADEPIQADGKTRAVRVGKRHSSVSEGVSKPGKEREQAPKRGAEEMRGDESRVDTGGLRRAERAERRRSMMV